MLALGQYPYLKFGKFKIMLILLNTTVWCIVHTANILWPNDWMAAILDWSTTLLVQRLYLEIWSSVYYGIWWQHCPSYFLQRLSSKSRKHPTIPTLRKNLPKIIIRPWSSSTQLQCIYNSTIQKTRIQIRHERIA